MKLRVYNRECKLVKTFYGVVKFLRRFDDEIKEISRDRDLRRVR